MADEDVIRTGFIYDPDTVDVIGNARILIGSAPFANAREPFAAAFKAEGADNDEGFAVVVNHFKSKGSAGARRRHRPGNCQPRPHRQANALKTFANEFAAARGVDAIFLTGDFNAYTKEDPVQVFTEDPVAPGRTSSRPTTPRRRATPSTAAPGPSTT